MTRRCVSGSCYCCFTSTVNRYIHVGTVNKPNQTFPGRHEVLNKLKSRGFRASSLSTYDFSTLYTTLPHNLIKDKLVDLIERTFQREGSLYIACNDRNAFFTSDAVRNYNLWSCQKVCEALTFLLDNIYIRLGSKLYRQIVGIPMSTNCAPLVADLFLFYYERDFMLSLSEDK